MWYLKVKKKTHLRLQTMQRMDLVLGLQCTWTCANPFHDSPLDILLFICFNLFETETHRYRSRYSERNLLAVILLPKFVTVMAGPGQSKEFSPGNLGGRQGLDSRPAASQGAH